VRRVLQVLGVIAVVALLAHLPWEALRRRWLVVTDVRVEGLQYLDAARVVETAGLREGQDLLGVDLARARQALLLDSRIERAEVRRRLPRGIEMRISERRPVLLVHHGVPWEIDSGGVLLAPLQEGVVADVPLLTGPRFERLPAGTHVGGLQVERGLRWIGALSGRELQLAGRVSEIDVGDPLQTALTLMNGTRVLGPAWPPPVRRLSALRVVLADLDRKGTAADEVDVRFDHQVIVRPAGEPEAVAHSG
jgi:hypothetical protein